jgi:HutP
MEMNYDRIGKIALLAAMSNESEERQLKQEINHQSSDFKVAVTVISGISSDIKKNFVKSIVGCSLQNNLIKKSGSQVHAVLHASLDAIIGVVHQVPAEASLRMKVGIATDGKWIAVALYGDSAFYPITNHERSALGVMHL